jgi:hypothetical protein
MTMGLLALRAPLWTVFVAHAVLMAPVWPVAALLLHRDVGSSLIEAAMFAPVWAGVATGLVRDRRRKIQQAAGQPLSVRDVAALRAALRTGEPPGQPHQLRAIGALAGLVPPRWSRWLGILIVTGCDAGLAGWLAVTRGRSWWLAAAALWILLVLGVQVRQERRIERALRMSRV